MTAGPHCPVCTTLATAQRDGSPYWVCPACDEWFQDPAPPKVFIGDHEHPGVMDDAEKQANEILATRLFDEVMRGKPGRTLDIGAQWPYLASRLKYRGCDAIAVDADARIDGWSESLGVPVLRANFEAEPDEHLAFCLVPRDFALITLIHSFEHLYDPLRALRKLRKYVAEDGRVFIRMPDHSVPGFERDLVDTHYKIHPFFHSFQTLLEMLVQVGSCFEVEHFAPMLGWGQSDIVLRPITKRPTLAIGVIERNEMRDLPRALKSVAAVADSVTIIDTGSNDGTLEAAVDMCFSAGVKEWRIDSYTEASEQDDAGNWRLTDFAKARNRAIECAPASAWYMWLDADDELRSPDLLRRLLYWPQYQCFGAMVQQGAERWVHHRLWQTSAGVRFEGRVHEYPLIEGLRTLVIDQFTVHHDAAPSPGTEDSNARNLRLLLLAFAEKPTPRDAFYIGSTHRDGGRFEEAIPWFIKRIEMGVAYRDEYLFAHLWLARCYRETRKYDQADEIAHAATLIEPTWAEFFMERGAIAYRRGDHQAAIGFATACIGMPVPPTELWREYPMYRDQPPRLLSWCHEHLGNMFQALSWAREANRFLVNDAEWQGRIARLEAMQQACPTCGRAYEPKAPAVVKEKRPVIGLCRPGAIGDILMTLNLIPALRAANPDHDIAYFCDARLGATDALGPTMRAAGIDFIYEHHNWHSWKGQFDRAVELTGYPLDEGYPERPMRRHLLSYFAEEMGLQRPPNERPHYWPLPSLTLPRPELRHAEKVLRPYITIQYRARWSKYKQWSGDLLEVVSKALPDVQLVPIDEDTGSTLSQSIALFANARMHVGVDSFCNHLTNYFWEDDRGGRRVPGVILWGSTQYDAAGYEHNTNLSKGLHCQPCFRENPAISDAPRGPCVNPPRVTYADDTPHACMAAISADEVIEAVRAMWETVK